MPTFPFYKQLDAMDCGPSCLRMIARYYGKTYTLQTLRDKSYISREGVSMMGISEAAEAIGFRTMGVSITAEKLFSSAPLPLIAHWKQNHFVVVYRVTRDKVFVADPAYGLVRYSKEEFLKGWISVEKDGPPRVNRKGVNTLKVHRDMRMRSVIRVPLISGRMMSLNFRKPEAPSTSAVSR